MANIPPPIQSLETLGLKVPDNYYTEPDENLKKIFNAMYEIYTALDKAGKRREVIWIKTKLINNYKHKLQYQETGDKLIQDGSAIEIPALAVEVIAHTHFEADYLGDNDINMLRSMQKNNEQGEFSWVVTIRTRICSLCNWQNGTKHNYSY